MHKLGIIHLSRSLQSGAQACCCTQIRICVDLTKLNESVQWELLPISAMEQILAHIAGAMVFFKQDSNLGCGKSPSARTINGQTL